MKSQTLMKRLASLKQCDSVIATAASPQVGVWLLLLANLCAAAVGPARAQTVAESAGWPRFLGENFDGVTPQVSQSIEWKSTPERLWTLEVGHGYGIGSVAHGRYFHFDAVPSPQTDRLEYQLVERLRAVDVATGHPVWVGEQPLVYRDMLGYENGPRSSPTIAGDRVFTLGVTGVLTCRNVSDGEQLWHVDTNQAYGVVQNFFGVGASPLVLGDRLIVMVGGSPSEDQSVGPMQLDRVSPNGSAVVAFDLQSGKELWRCGEDLASYSSPRPITVDGETFVLVFLRSGLMAIDPDAGQVLWRYDHRARILESVNAMMPVVRDDQVLISECYEVGSVVLKVSKTGCSEVWKDPSRDRRSQSFRAHWATPILVGEHFYGCSGRNAPDSDFRCVEFATGKVLWSDPRRIRSSVTRIGEYLLVFEERGRLQLIRPNPEALEVIADWDLAQPLGGRRGLAYPCWAAPIVVDNQVILRGTDQVVCLQFADAP